MADPHGLHQEVVAQKCWRPIDRLGLKLAAVGSPAVLSSVRNVHGRRVDIKYQSTWCLHETATAPHECIDDVCTNLPIPSGHRLLPKRAAAVTAPADSASAIGPLCLRPNPAGHSSCLVSTYPQTTWSPKEVHCGEAHWSLRLIVHRTQTLSRQLHADARPTVTFLLLLLVQGHHSEPRIESQNSSSPTMVHGP
jgi:hypothetical protein